MNHHTTSATRRGPLRARVAALVGLGLLAVGVGISATPAEADAGKNRVTLSGSIFIHDDDWVGDDNGTHIFSGVVTVGGSVFSKTYNTSGCVGGEVRGELRVIVEDHNGGWVKVRVRGRLYEQESCSNSDLDGDSGEIVRWVPSGHTATMRFRVHNGEPFDGGYNDYTLRVQNLPA